ncbi:hypothetical protein D6779_09725, partial [Candidatus Parcubacteria bacterium]
MDRVHHKAPTLILIAVAITLALPTIGYAANIFSEDFNALTPSTNITTSNTNFDYVRIGSGGGSITAEQATSGEMHMRIGGSTNTSLNGVGIQSSLGGQTVLTMNFRLKLEDTNGDLFIGAGTGNTFIQNGIFSTGDLMFGIQSNNGTLQYRTTAWQNVGMVLSANTNYEFHIVVNRSGSTINYGSNSVTDGHMDLFIDGTLVGDDLQITNNQNASGFRIYQINGGHYARVDSITLDNTALAPFAPTALTLKTFGARSFTAGYGALTVLALLALGGLT